MQYCETKSNEMICVCINLSNPLLFHSLSGTRHITKATVVGSSGERKNHLLIQIYSSAFRMVANTSSWILTLCTALAHSDSY